MTASAGGAVTVLVGAVLLRLALTGTYQRYVRTGLGPWLALAGALVLLLGVVTLLRARRPAGAGAGHGHHRVGWLLLVPVATLLLVAPPALGSFGVDRAPTVDIRAGGSGLPPLPPLPQGPAPVPLTLLEFNQRAFDRGGASLAGVPVQLTGFVADHSDRFRLVRYQIACCAVDAAPVVVLVVGVVGAPPPPDRWVTVTGTFQPGPGDPPVLAATSVVDVPPPEDPYE